jgi:hypothetical protein
VSNLRPITQQEWDEYEWIEVTTWGDAADGKKVYVRGLKNAGNPPDDGFLYDCVADMGKGAYVWVQRMTAEEPK